jgi:hypothetical protein
MECWTLLYGGYNYSAPSYTEAEHHDSIKAAEDTFWRWVDEPHNMADDSTQMYVYLYEPDEGGDNYPDFRIFQGPRGGIRRERV